MKKAKLTKREVELLNDIWKIVFNVKRMPEDYGWFRNWLRSREVMMEWGRGKFDVINAIKKYAKSRGLDL